LDYYRDFLYEFQVADVDKLADRRGRLIASEMGTGKTPTGVGLDQFIDHKLPTLVVAPSGVLPAWNLHFTRNDRPVVICNRKDRVASWSEFARRRYEGVFLVHWEALRLIPELNSIAWGHIIADECHKMQNRKALMTQALKRLQAQVRTGLSGTPITGSPDKYWSVMNWMYPREFTSYWSFYKQYVDYEIIQPQGYFKIKGPKNEDQLLERVEPFYVRHLKKEQCCPNHPQGVMPWLPDKVYSTVWVDLDPKQRRAYDQMKRDMIAWVNDQEDTPLVARAAVSQLARLQQFADSHANVTDDGTVVLCEPSSKLDALMELLEDNPGERFVVFSQFRQLVDLLARRLNNERIPYATYTGANVNTRDTELADFASGRGRVFIGTISAGGVGVDGLQNAASTIVFLDRTWSPALNSQAEDRLHRDGQKSVVNVVDIMARGTVDLGRQQRLDMKWDWIKRLLGDKIEQKGNEES
jgi:SNF2 family DNA or RNA helicase